MFEEEMRELIRAEIRPSKQRLQILRYLNHLGEQHPTVEEMYRHLQDTRGISVATLYNTVNLFVEKGLLNCLEYPGQNARYDRHLETHAHFYCRCCEHLYDLPLEDKISVPKHFRVEETQVLLQGVCDRCRERAFHG